MKCRVLFKVPYLDLDIFHVVYVMPPRKYTTSKQKGKCVNTNEKACGYIENKNVKLIGVEMRMIVQYPKSRLIYEVPSRKFPGRGDAVRRALRRQGAFLLLQEGTRYV